MSYSSKIADYVRFYSAYLPTIGLYHGRMGVLLALRLYGLQNKDKLFEETATWLLEDVMERVDDRLPVGMEHGLVGIAFGVTLLHRYAGMEADLNDVLAEVDQWIMGFDVRRMEDVSFRSGLMGVVAYVNLRMSCGNLTSLDAQYLHELSMRCQSLALSPQAGAWQLFLTDLDVPAFAATDYENKSIALCGGSSYYLLKSYDALLSCQ